MSGWWWSSVAAHHPVAIGWVHNLNAYWEKHFYATHDVQNFLGCTTPNTQQVSLPGFRPGPNYYISYFATRMNDTIHPADSTDLSGTGTVLLDLSTAPLNGIANNYLDTLHSDYAFIISSGRSARSLIVHEETDTSTSSVGWDFNVYPVPAREEVFVRFPDDGPRVIMIHDLSGRMVRQWSSVTGALQRLNVAGLAKGAYYLLVTNGQDNKTKKLLIR